MDERDQSIVRILIQMGLDKSGAEQAVEEINRVKEAQSGLGANVPEAWKSWERYKHVLSETGEESLSAHEKFHVLHLALHGLGAEIPHLSMLLRGLFNPLTAGIVVGTVAVEGFFKWIEKGQEALRETIKDLEEYNHRVKEILALGPSVASVWRDAAKSTAEAAAEVGSVIEQLKLFSELNERFDQVSKDSLSRRLAAENDILDVQKAQVELARTLGVINDEVAKQQELWIDFQKKVQESLGKVAEARAALASAQSEADQVAKRAGAAGFGVAAVPTRGPDGKTAYTGYELAGYEQQKVNADQAVKAAQGRVAEDEAWMKLAERGSKEAKAEGGADWLKDKIEEQEGVLRRLKSNDLYQAMDLRTGKMRGTETEEKIAEFRKELNDLNKHAAEAHDDYAAAQTALADANRHLADLSALYTKFDALNNNLSKLNEALLNASSSSQQQNQTASQKFSLEALAQIISGTGKKPGQITGEGLSALNALRGFELQGFTQSQSWARLTEAQRTQIELFEEMLRDIGVNAQATADMVVRLGDAHQDGFLKLRQALEEQIRRVYLYGNPQAHPTPP